MKLVWARRALSDLRRIADHIAADNPAAADKLVAAFRHKAANLEQFPLMGRAGGYGDARELVVHKNDLLTFRLRGDEVQVLQVWHVARATALTAHGHHFRRLARNRLGTLGPNITFGLCGLHRAPPALVARILNL